MADEKNSGCDCKCGCSNAKNSSYLQIFLLIIMVIIVSGIFYSMQGMMSMCAMKSGDCAMSAGKMAPCPLTGKMMPKPAQ